VILFPGSGRVVPEFNNKQLRELIEGNYRIVYRFESNELIEIARIHHSARHLK
jgi:toxin ParE1/3/4